jgi:hypothetical protein
MNIDEALDLLSEDVLGDLKRKLKGQVSLAENIRRVAKQALRDAEIRFELVEDLAAGKQVRGQTSIPMVAKAGLKAIKDANRDLDRIK